MVGELVNPEADPLADAQLTMRIFDLIRRAANCNALSIGSNDAFWTVSESISELVVIAADTEYIEDLDSLKLYAISKSVPYVFVPSKRALGRACGDTKPILACSVTVTREGQLTAEILQIRDAINRLI